MLLIQSSIRAKKKYFFTLNQSSISAKKLTKIVQTQLRWAWHNLGQHSCTQDVNAHKSKLIGAKICIPQYGHKQERVSWLPICIWIFIHKPFTLNFFSHVEQVNFSSIFFQLYGIFWVIISHLSKWACESFHLHQMDLTHTSHSCPIFPSITSKIIKEIVHTSSLVLSHLTMKLIAYNR